MVLAAQEVVNSLQVLEVLAPSVHPDLQPEVSAWVFIVDSLCSAVC